MSYESLHKRGCNYNNKLSWSRNRTHKLSVGQDRTHKLS